MKEQVRTTKLINRRKAWEQFEWEQERIINRREKIREMYRQSYVERARHDPPVTEIISGTALNTLRTELGMHSLSQGDSTPVKSDWLAHINVNSGIQPGNAGPWQTKTQ